MSGLSGLVIELKKIAKKMGIQPGVVRAKSLPELLAGVSEDHKKRMLSGDAMFTDAQGHVMYVYIDKVNNATRDFSERYKVHVYRCNALTKKAKAGEAADYVGVVNATDTGFFPLSGGQMVQMPLCENCFDKMVKEEFGLAKLESHTEYYYKNLFRELYYKQDRYSRDGTRIEQFMYGTYAKKHYQEIDYGNRQQGQRLNFDFFEV